MKRRPANRHLAMLMIAATTATTAAASEQRARSESSGSTLAIEEIVVTAQMRTESIQDVPISVTALTGERMDQLNAITLESLQGYVPNVQVQSFANANQAAVFNIRGMGIIEPTPYGGTTVVVVEDGVPQFYNTAAFLDTFDIERLEVLRGPQGTLFGANATGGVIQVINKAPSGEREARISASYGNYDLLDIRAAADFPIIEDVLAARITGSKHSRDGYLTNIVTGRDINGQNRSMLRGQLFYTPTENFDARLILQYAKQDTSGNATVSGSVPGDRLFIEPGTTFPSITHPNAFSQEPMYASPCLPAGSRCKAPGKYKTAMSNVEPFIKTDTYTATLNMNIDTSWGRLTSITGYKEFEYTANSDQNLTPVFGSTTDVYQDAWQFSQEIRAEFSPNERLDLMAGAFYGNYQWDHWQDFRIQFAVPGLRQLTEHESKTETGSLFLQSYYQLSDTLDFQAGLRVTREKTQFGTTITNFLDSRGTSDHLGSPLNMIGGPFETLLNQIAPKDSETWTNVGGKIGLQYRPSSDLMLYGYYARGFKSGGFVGRILRREDMGPFDEEYVDTIELGLKSDWLDGRLRLNTAAFFNWYDDMQLATVYYTEDELGNQVSGSSIVNAADSETWGIEVDAIYVPTDSLRVNLSFAYLNAEYTDFLFFDANQIGEFEDLSGSRLQNAPKWTANTGIQYVHSLGRFDLTTNLQYKYVGKKYNFNLRNTPRSEIQPTHLVDLNVDLSPVDANWSVGVWARNLFDNRYMGAVFDAPGTVALAQYQPPRTYGVTLRFDM